MKEINESLAVERFQAMVRKKTVSAKDGNFDKEEFASFLPMLKEKYPTVFGTVEARLINEFGILIRWRGKDENLNPVVLMAHHDVVSDEGQDWLHPAFEAEIHDGCIWGRGTIDTKCLFASALEAMERLIADGFTPERDIYFASSNCEEIGGDTMPKIVEWFTQNKISPWFILDEGGAIMSNLPMGIKTPFAMVAVSEKGWGSVKLTARSKTAAHGAKALPGDKVPAPTKLIRALAKLDKTPVKAELTPAVAAMLKSFAPYIDGPVKAVLNNISVFGPVVKKVLASNADTAAMISSAINLTKLEAGNEKGTVPDTATAQLNLKIAPHDTFDGVVEHIKSVVGDEIEVEVLTRSDPPAISDHNTKSFEIIKSTIKNVFPDVGVSPFILNAGTDARHFAKICKEVYRFGAFRLDDDLFATVHSANERMPVKDYIRCIEFYTELISNIN
ncbi:MAG: M20/M25/M40 family metallo-hydrolase [Clostridia bacterium]|nr:M20/M25/M40 family metallo-hydrolase [Clostridia bacterium]